MLFYVKCPSCSRLLSKHLDKYAGELDNIRDNPDMDKLEKEEASAELLNKYGYKKLCCRIRILGLIPYHEIVIT